MSYTGKKVERDSGGNAKGPGKYRFSITRFESKKSAKGNPWWSYDLKLYGPGDNEGFEVKYLAFFESSQDALDCLLTVVGCTEAGIPFIKEDKDLVGKHGVVLMQYCEELDRDDDTKIWRRLRPLRWGAWYDDDERSPTERNNGKEAEAILKNMDKCEEVVGLWGKDKSRYEAAMKGGGSSAPASEDKSADEDMPF